MQPDAFTLFPAQGSAPVFYLFSEPEVCAELFDGSASLVSIQGVDWDRDLTPWPAPGTAPGRDFTGGAEDFLRRLLEELVPAAERKLTSAPPHRGLVGYSLAGLFSLWTLYQTPCFDRIGSVSGSLWYDGWLDYIRRQAPQNTAGVYLSVGAREKRARDLRMAGVEAATRQTAQALSGAGLRVRCEINPGGHFTDPAGRLRRALQALTAGNGAQK